MSNKPFGNTTVQTQGYLELSGCATLAGTTSLSGNIRIADPSGITLTNAAGSAAFSGDGFLQVAAGITNWSDLTITADPLLGPLKYLIFDGAADQPLRTNVTGLTAQEIHFKGSIKNIELNGTLFGKVIIWPLARLRAPAANRLLTINGSVENRGTFSNDYSPTVKMSGDIINSGPWGPAVTELMGNGPRTIGG